MLSVIFYRDSRNRLSSVFARGHAGWADAGDDIVCAAASAILQAAQLGLADHAKTKLEVGQRAGELRLRWPEADRDDAAVAAIVRTAELAIESLAKQYPEHVTAHTEREP